jgi:hypothetical protein
MDSHLQGDCSHWQAWHAISGGKSTLHVSGRCQFPTDGFKVKLIRAVPQGINPRILILEKVVTAPSGPVAQVITTEHVAYCEEAAPAQFSHVTILPDGPTVPVKEASSQLPAAIFRHWVHSREEDTRGAEMYRPDGFAFPPSHGRDGFEMRKTGEFIQDDIGPADGIVQVRGRWESRGPNEVTALFQNPKREDYTFALVTVDQAALTISRVADDQGHEAASRKSFEGTSTDGNLQKALNQAIAAAQSGVTIADWLTEWTMKSISGRRGGIAGFDEVTVTIDATMPQ